MKTKTKYVDELTGQEFDTEKLARKSESRSKDLKKIFSFWKNIPEDGTCNFSNGGWCYQRTEEEYHMLLDNIIKALKKHEPWIVKQYKDHGGLKREYIHGSYILGRYVDDGNSPLREWVYKTSNICKKCYREWGQPYYAIHCKHNVQPRLLKINN